MGTEDAADQKGGTHPDTEVTNGHCLPESESHLLCDEEKNSTTSLPTALDGGWGWVVCAGAFLCMVILDGMMFSFGVLLLELLDYFQEGKGKTAMVGSALMGTHLIAGPVVSAMVNAWGIRTVTCAGGLVAGVAFATSTFSPSVTVLMTLYGFVGGFGVSMIYLPSILAVGFYFEKKRALANGITQSGSGIGAFLYSPLTDYLQYHFGWKGALLIMAGIVLHCIVFGALYRPIRIRQYVQREADAVHRKSCDSGSPENEQMILSREKMASFDSAGVVSNSCEALSSRTPQNSVIPNKQVARLKLEALGGTRDVRPVIPEYANGTLHIGSVPSVQALSQGLVPKRKQSDHLFVEQSPFMQNSVSCDALHAAQVGELPRSRSSMATAPHHEYVYLKPIHRKDLFYSGSLLRIPEYRVDKSSSLYSLPKTDGASCPFGESPDERNPPADLMSIGGGKMGKIADLVAMFKEMTGLSLLKNPLFIVPTLSMVLWTTHSTILAFLADYAVLRGHSTEKAALLLSIIGCANTLARIGAGWISDRPGVDCLWLNITALFVGGVTCILVPFSSLYALLGVEATVFGLCMGTWTSLRPIILVELLGLDNLTNSFGLVAMFQGVAFLVGPPIAGTLYDNTKSHLATFFLAGVAFVISGVLCLPLRRLAKRYSVNTSRRTFSRGATTAP